MTKLSANFFLGALFFHVNGECYEGANFQAIAGGCDDFRENLDKAGKREFDAAYNEMEKAFDDEMDATVAAQKTKTKPVVYEGTLGDVLLELDEAAKLGIYSKAKAKKMEEYCKAHVAELEEYVESMKLAEVTDLISHIV